MTASDDWRPAADALSAQLRHPVAYAQVVSRLVGLGMEPILDEYRPIIGLTSEDRGHLWEYIRPWDVLRQCLGCGSEGRLPQCLTCGGPREAVDGSDHYQFGWHEGPRATCQHPDCVAGGADGWDGELDGAWEGEDAGLGGSGEVYGGLGDVESNSEIFLF